MHLTCWQVIPNLFYTLKSVLGLRENSCIRSIISLIVDSKMPVSFILLINVGDLKLQTLLCYYPY
jgi:hypothetical protein